VHWLALRFEVNPQLALAVIAVESGFNAAAVSLKNAQGLMRLVFGTAQRFNVKNAFEPAENLRGGLGSLRWLLSYYRGEVTLALAAYNAGERAVDRHRGVPPYPATWDYVQTILFLFRRERHAFDEWLNEASPIVGTTGRREM